MSSTLQIKRGAGAPATLANGELAFDTTNKVLYAGDGSANYSVSPIANGSRIKHARVTTGSVTAASTALITVTWTTAFADANYTVMAQVLDSTASSLSLSVVHIESISASAVTVRVLNNAVGSLTGTLHVLAVHD